MKTWIRLTAGEAVIALGLAATGDSLAERFDPPIDIKEQPRAPSHVRT